MSIPLTYNWPLADNSAIVSSTMLGAGIRTFTFNGNIAPSAGGAVVLNGISRTVSITSTSNLSAINFTITGSDYNGNPLSCTIAGPNATTIYTTGYNFWIIISCSVSADMTAAASIGTGVTGYTNWFAYDIMRTFSSLALQAVVTGNINYTFALTLDNVKSFAIDSSITSFATVTGMTEATTTQYANTTLPMYYGRMVINDLFYGSVYAASTANLTATYANGTAGVGATLTNAGAFAIFAIDGVTPPLNSIILIKDQTTGFQNGIYKLTTVGDAISVNWVLTRATNYNAPSKIHVGDSLYVMYGTVNKNTFFKQTATVATIGTDTIIFASTNLNSGLLISTFIQQGTT